MFELPNFKLFEPFKLKQLHSKVVEKDIEFIFSEKRIDLAIKKLKTNNQLFRRDYKILCFHLNKILEENLFDMFFFKVDELFTKQEKLYPFLKGLLRSYYNLKHNNNKVFHLLKKGFSKEEKVKPDLENIKNLIKESNSREDLIDKIFKSIMKIYNKDQLLVEIQKCLLKPTDLFSKILFYAKGKYMVVNNEHIKYYEYFLEHLDEFLDLNYRKKIYEIFLLKEKNNKDFNNLGYVKDHILEHIRKELGDPYGTNIVGWQNISEEAIQVFRLWLAQKNLSMFFINIVGNPRRLAFWQKYRSYFYRIEYIKSLGKVLLMETADHLFVEFADSGAFYMYDKSYLNIEKVKNMAKIKSKTEMVSKVIKNRYNCLLRIEHSGNWEYKFAQEFQYYNYYPKR